MNYIWPLMIIFSLFCAIASNSMNELSSSVLQSGADSIELAIKLTGVICLWNGLISIAEKSGLTKALSKLLSPVLKLLFPKLTDEKAKQAIAMNMTANILGLDNAATPLGLEAMSRLKELNPSRDTASDYMVRFVVINTASLHLVSTTVAMLRQQHGSAAPMEILLPALCTSVCSLCMGLIMTTLLKKVFK